MLYILFCCNFCIWNVQNWKKGCVAWQRKQRNFKMILARVGTSIREIFCLSFFKLRSKIFTRLFGPSHVQKINKRILKYTSPEEKNNWKLWRYVNNSPIEFIFPYWTYRILVNYSGVWWRIFTLYWCNEKVHYTRSISFPFYLSCLYFRSYFW